MTNIYMYSKRVCDALKRCYDDLDNVDLRTEDGIGSFGEDLNALRQSIFISDFKAPKSVVESLVDLESYWGRVKGHIFLGMEIDKDER